VDRHALSKDSEAIDSLACEGALLARDAANDRTTSPFVRVHAGNLRRRASNFEDALAQRPTVEAIERDVRALARRAGSVAALLDGLEDSPTDRENARRLATALSKSGDCA
jgi:hypothetical protein